jgi:hypothetical protein
LVLLVIADHTKKVWSESIHASHIRNLITQNHSIVVAIDRSIIKLQPQRGPTTFGAFIITLELECDHCKYYVLGLMRITFTHQLLTNQAALTSVLYYFTNTTPLNKAQHSI